MNKLEDKKEKEKLENMVEMLSNSIVVDQSESDNTFGKDLQMIFQGIIDDRNTLRFTDSSNVDSFHYAYCMSMRDSHIIGNMEDEFAEKIDPLSALIDRFMYHYTICNSAKKTDIKKKNFLDKTVEVAGSLLGFKSMLDYRSAGIRDKEDSMSFVDKLKGGL